MNEIGSQHPLGGAGSVGSAAGGIASTEMSRQMQAILDESLAAMVAGALKDVQVGTFTSVASFKQGLEK